MAISEESSIKKVRNSFDKYKAQSEKQTTFLTKQNEQLKIKLAFYLFSYNLYHGLLSDEVKGIFNRNNKDNKRIFIITREYKKWENEELQYENLPLELKMVTKELD